MAADLSTNQSSLTFREKTAAIIFSTIWASALILVPLLPKETLTSNLWAFRHLQDIPLWVRGFLGAVCIAFAIPSINRIAWTAFEQVRSKTNRPPSAIKTAVIIIAGVVLFATFWFLRSRNYALGDSALLTQLLTRDVHMKGFHITFDEPLELYVHSIAYRFLHATLNWSVAETYALISCGCGLAAAFLIMRIWGKTVSSFSDRFVAAGLCLSMGGIQLFFGYVENYTIVFTCILLYILLAKQALDGSIHIFWPALALSLAFCFHVLAGWLFPSLFYIWLNGTRKQARKQSMMDFIMMSAAVLLPIAAMFSFFLFIGVKPQAVQETHLWKLKFIFLLNENHPGYQYPICSWEHFSNVINQILLTGLPGIISILGVWLWRPTTLRMDRFLIFLVLSALFFQIFAATWNPEIGAYKDWDLFAVVGLGYTLLGAHVFIKYLPDASIRYLGLMIITISLTLSGSWVLSNTQERGVPDSIHFKAHLSKGIQLEKQQVLSEAEWHFSEAVRANPLHPDPHLILGRFYYKQGNKQKAAEQLKIYLKLDPGGRYTSWANKVMQELKYDMRKQSP